MTVKLTSKMNFQGCFKLTWYNHCLLHRHKEELNYSPCVTGSYLPPLIKKLDACCSSPCPNYWIASEKMYTDRSSERSCHFFEGKSAYVTEVIWNAVGPFPIQPCSWPPLVSCKAQAGEFKKKRQTYYTHSGYLLLLLLFFNLDVSFSIGVRGRSRKGCSLSG